MADLFYGLLGRKLGHSWSVPIHKQLGCESYCLKELEPDALPSFLKRTDIGGLNVTIPYKREVIRYCDVVDKAAADAGSVNTIVRRFDGRLYAYNTDLEGFRYMLKLAGLTISGKKVIILGSGGTSLTAQVVSAQLGASEIVVVSRSGPNHYQNLSRHADAQILINTTPVGMYPDNGRSPVRLSDFPKLTGVVDVIYNPRRTALLLEAQRLGIPCCDGLPMLVAQAVISERLFFDYPISDEQIQRILSTLRQEQTNMVLIGMPGCGKSTVGAALASLTGRQMIDLDCEIEKGVGMSIPAYFAKYGETMFRALECEAVQAAGKLNGKIIVTGGGVVKNASNYAPLTQNGRIYHLTRAIDALSTEGRPLSTGADLYAMWAERKGLYETFEDVSCSNDGTPQAAAEKIWRDFIAYCGD